VGILLLLILLKEIKHTRITRQIGKLLSAARHKATVLREGRLSSIDQDDVVIGDVLLIGKGDEVLADGTILESSQFSVDLSPLKTTQEIVEKFAGDQVAEGSYCEAGWAIFRVDHIPVEIDLDEISTVAAPSTEIRTPLQKGIQGLLLILLAIAGIFYGILIVEMLRFEAVPPELVAIYRQAISIIFSIAPSGLLFMVVLNYAVGSANIAGAGALIKSSQTIEVLSQVNSLILLRKKDLNSLTLQIEMIPNEQGEFAITETRARQILANYIHSIPTIRYPFSVIKGELEGQRYPLKREARFFSLLGWEAVNFDSDDMPGTYVIGYPDTLKNHLNNPQTYPGQHPVQVQPKALTLDRHDRWHKLTHQIKTLIFKRETTPAAPNINQPEGESSEPFRLLFAYSPKTLSTKGALRQPPGELIPICFLDLIKVYHPEMKAAFQGIRDAGIALKIMSTGRAQNMDGLANVLEIDDQNALAAHVISGQSFTSLDIELIREKSIFIQLSTEQMLQVINTLQNKGEVVALQSDLITDIPLMSQADIGITSLGSSHKLIAKSDVILMKSSPLVLPIIFRMSQNIVQSVVNLLKLNLTKIAYVLILIIAMFLTGNRRFIFEPTHGTIIGLFTITLPSIFISVWTNSLKARRERINKQLGSFIIPAAITTALTVIVTYLLFNWQEYLFFRIQHIITHLLVLIGLALVVFCYPPRRQVLENGTTIRDWRMTGVALALYGVFHMLTFIPALQMSLRLVPLISLRDYLMVWIIGLFWASMTQLLWYLIRRDTTTRYFKTKF
jgi:cation-transporting P-type ATPase E